MQRTTRGRAPLEHLVWLDMEMTNPNVKTGRILEVAAVVTEGAELREVGEPFHVVVRQSRNTQEQTLSGWSRKTFQGSGLLDMSEQSEIGERDAEELLLGHLDGILGDKPACVAGTSVHVDQQFLKRYMPRVYRRLGHRVHDVSSFLQWFKMKGKSVQLLPARRAAHRALDDTYEAIELMRALDRFMVRA